MANNTPNLDISHIATNQNQKEVTANTAFDELDGALTALLAKALPDSDYTLTATEGGEALGNMAFKFTGTLTGAHNVIVPAVTKLYICSNATTGGYTITVKTASGTGVALTNGGGYAVLYCDGTNVVQITAAGGLGGAELTAHKDQPSGYAGLDSNGFLKAAEDNLPFDARTTTTETVNDNDRGKLVTFSNGSPVAASIAQAGTGGNFAASWYSLLWNEGAGAVTLTPATSTVNGGVTVVLLTNTGGLLFSDGTNYQFLPFGLIKPTVAVTHQYVTAIAADGTATLQQPSAADLSDGNSGTGNVAHVTSAALVTPSIGGETITKAPRATYSAYIDDPSAATGLRARLIPDQAITITRISVVLVSAGAGTSTQAVIRVTDGTSNEDTTLTDATTTFDSGALSVNVAAGANLDISLLTASSGGTAPVGAVVTVQYKMQ